MLARRIGTGSELRLLEEHHAEELYALIDANRARLAEWLPWAEKLRGPEDSLGFIRATREQLARNQGIQCGIWVGDKLAGVVGFAKIDWRTFRAEFGYWLGASYEGQGLMTRAVAALLDHAFGDLRLRRVEIRCAVGNARSRAIPRRLGFREEATLREVEFHNGTLTDGVVYGLLASEWKGLVSS